jgi:hypothetical protein
LHLLAHLSRRHAIASTHDADSGCCHARLCSPTILRHALKAASSRKIPILSVAQALDRAGA